MVNPTAGRGRTRALLPRLSAALEEHGALVRVSTDTEDGRHIAREAFARGEGVLACGGDGTVSALAAVANEMDGPLALVPTGAGNDFARHLGLDPHQPLDALSLLETGHLARCDLGVAHVDNGTRRVFTTVANTGFDAEANRWANQVRWSRGTALYVIAALRTLATYRPQPMCVRVDGEEWRGEAWLVAIGNTRCYAGGMMITPAARADDGLLDVCIVARTPIRRFLVEFRRVFKGTHVDIDGVVTLRGTQVTVESPDSPIPMELWASGERVGPLPARLETIPNALRVLTPNTQPARPEIT